MALVEEEREDLFEESSGIKPKIEWTISQSDDFPFNVLLMGFRKLDRFTIFLDQNFVLTFSSELQIRRVFLNGVIYRAENGRQFSKIVRNRSRNQDGKLQSELLSHILSDDQQIDLLNLLHAHLQEINERLRSGCFVINRMDIQSQSCEKNILNTFQKIAGTQLCVADGMT